MSFETEHQSSTLHTVLSRHRIYTISFSSLYKKCIPTTVSHHSKVTVSSAEFLSKYLEKINL